MKWSYSTHKAMRKCPRQVVFTQIVATHGQKQSHRREAFTLKQLQSVSAWQGSIVHKVLARRFVADLQLRKPFDWDAYNLAAAELVDRQFAFSRAKRYRDADVTKSSMGDDFCALTEHDRGAELPANTLEQVKVAVATAIDNLRRQENLLQYLRNGHAFVTEQTVHFKLIGLEVPLTATADLVFRRPSGELAILDWKIGESGTAEYSMQLLTYAVALPKSSAYLGVDPLSTHLVEANLLKNHVRSHAVNADRLIEAEDFIFRSASDLAELLAGVEYDSLDLTDFDAAENPNTCAFCNFRSLCCASVEPSASTDESPAQGSLFDLVLG
jgi:hypothetical protein